VRRITSSRWLRLGFGILALALLLYAIVDQWHNVGPKLGDLTVPGVALSGLAMLIGMVAMLKTWQVTMAGLGSPLRTVQAGRIYYLGQLGKYVPGSVWPMVVQTELGADVGVPRSSSVVAVLFYYLLFTTSSALVSAVCLPWVTHLVPIWLAVLALVVGVVLMAPPVVNRLVAIGMKVLRKPSRPQLTLRPILVSFGWALVMWACFGTHILLLVHTLGHDFSWHLALLCVGGYTLAWVCGFLFILAPAGGGIRELLITALLAGTIGHDTAFTVAIVSRLMVTVGDLFWAFLAAVSLGPAKLRELRARGERPEDAHPPAHSAVG